MSAWRDLHRQYYQAVLAFLRRLGVQEVDLDDTCQEVFLQLFRSLSQFRGDSELKTWLYRLCASQASRLRRRKFLITKLKLWFFQSEGDDASVDASETSLIVRATLDRALATLTEKERLVFVLFELEGLSGAEVAKIAECPINTVWRRLFDARRRLKVLIEQEDV
jgi:RNA polymerase sigma-70 factor (ECF subfamily)